MRKKSLAKKQREARESGDKEEFNRIVNLHMVICSNPSEAIEIFEKRYNSSKCAYRYAVYYKDVDERIERIIRRSSKYSYYYAYDILQSRFKEGEKIISKSAKYSYLYAVKILENRFFLGEKVIYQSKKYNMLYKNFLDNVVDSSLYRFRIMDFEDE